MPHGTCANCIERSDSLEVSRRYSFYVCTAVPWWRPAVSRRLRPASIYLNLLPTKPPPPPPPPPPMCVRADEVKMYKIPFYMEAELEEVKAAAAPSAPQPQPAPGAVKVSLREGWGGVGAVLSTRLIRIHSAIGETELVSRQQNCRINSAAAGRERRSGRNRPRPRPSSRFVQISAGRQIL